ncbi:Membrane protein involved in the export of O-antigen and teichoic acid [Hymenobacter gelipurpurascens]|uniref:Membrane protein involved in the export of O-antigen and teichoic acid n=1 Tax=Hymenobacter gelipurpurascens TaxID=89968 RepID=A0A212TKL4_9BACT|nr:lipopolysaccharide biosynthesis protein [Hymenobacter gelipurpurascens]SNC66430.1 Membrane protein involved in the export of O-antigen and teichoic acid [Hymenobacter gelipurpurascens]
MASTPKASLTSATLRGMQWTTLATIATAVMQIGYTAVMARLLDPAAFGLVAMAGVVLRFGGYFAEMGLGHALVQRPQLTPYTIRAVFTASMVLGIAVAGIMWLLAPLAVFFLKNEGVVPLVRALSLGFVVNAAGMTASSLLRRELQFDTLAKIDIAAYVLAYGGLGIGLAWAGAGVWSLIAASLAQQFLVTVFAYATVRHSVKFLLGWEHYAPLLSYGGQVSVISFLEFLNTNMDTLLIGRLLGSAPLGIYNRAYMLLYLPAYFLSFSVGKVAFPAFSQLQEDPRRLGAVYLTCTTLVASLILPLCAGVAIAAPEIVRVLLGPRWTEAVPVLQVLSLAIPLIMTTLFAGIVADARANLRQKMALNLQYITLLVLLFLGLYRFGLLGIAAAIGLGEIARAGLYMRLTHQDLQLSFRQLLGVYGPGLRGALGVGLTLLLVSEIIRPLALPGLVALLLQMVMGAVSLGILLFRWPSPELRPWLLRALHAVYQQRLVPQRIRMLLDRYFVFLEQTEPQPAAA